MQYRITLIIGLLFVSLKAIAFKHFTVANGLISNTIYNTYRDSKGYLWFATDKGVARFNGKEFKNFTILDGVTDNAIMNFHEDKLGRLWVFTFNGSSCFIYRDKVHNAANNPLLKQLPVTSFIRTICNTGNDSTLYIGYRAGTVIKINGTTISYLMKQDPRYANLSCLYWQHDTLRIFSSGRECLMRNDTVLSDSPKMFFTAFAYNDTVLLTDDDGMHMSVNDRTVWQLKSKHAAEQNVIKLYRSNAHKIFCCTKKGLLIIDPEQHAQKWLLRDIPVTAVCEDINGNYWVATLGHGIYNFNEQQPGIQLIGASDTVNFTYAGNGQLFRHTNGSTSIFEPSSGLFNDIEIKPGENYTPLFDNGNYLIYDNGTSTLIVHKPREKLISVFPGIYKTCYSYDTDKFIFAGNGNFNNVLVTPKGPVIRHAASIRERITSIAFDGYRKQLYFIADNLLYAYDPKTFRLDRRDSFSSQLTPVGIYQYRGKLVVLIPPNRFFIYNTVDHKRTEIVVRNLAFFALSDIGNGDYLAQTSNGLYLLKVNGDALVNSRLIKVEYPYNETEIEKLYTCGPYIFCSINGNIYQFNKNLINKKLNRPVLFIDKISVNEKTADTTYYNVSNSLKCNIRIQANSLYFGNDHTSYQYRIITPAETSQWFAGSSGEFNILLPDYGTYRVEVKAVSNNNIASPSQFFTVSWQPPFFLAWWFKIFAAIALGCTILYAIRYFNSRKQRSFQNELNYLQLEHKAINSLLNPHFIFNAINNIQDLVNRKEAEEANDYLAMLSRLIRQNIENLQFNLIPLGKELQLITNYIHLQNLRFGGKIKLVIDNEVPKEEIYIPPLLVHTFVENAVVHGFSTSMETFTITITIHYHNGNQVKISIADNGFGMGCSHRSGNGKEKTSLGIGMTEKRLARLSQFYKVPYELSLCDRRDSGQTGAQVTIVIYSKFSALLPVD